MSSVIRTPAPWNEPVLEYRPGSAERDELKDRLGTLKAEEIEIPLLIGGREIRTGDVDKAVMPHRHRHVLATWHQAGPAEIEAAIDAAVGAQREWASWRWEDRAAVFLKAADLLAGTWRATLNGSTMLVQSKTAHQAEIDSACELIDFFRFNVAFAEQLYEQQPLSGPGMWNRMDYRPLEGFVYAVTPFNFTSIAGNLPTAPAIMGNAVVWKPASSTVYSGYYIARLLEAAGLPPGVINFVAGPAADITEVVLNHREFAGIHFTGSTPVFQYLWRMAAENLPRYRSYPRLVGETGGKDFIIAHPSTDPDAVRTAVVRGGYEYQGQKCSAVSRVYVPQSMWRGMRDRLIEEIDAIAMGDVADFRNFMGAVIDRNAFDSISGYIEGARRSSDSEIVAGGEVDDSEGYFIRPTLIRTENPRATTMCEEIFGPVVTLYVYPDGGWADALQLVETTSPYALTGAVFATDRAAVREADAVLRNAAGNFYINDKPTGAVVGQQPFGGGRASGTNDKAGSILNLVRWVSPRSIKETFVPATDYRYPFMDES
jgi:1-pyrroline-5-carboxylate dehydrogenase